jgi:hypothetical protein
VTTYPRAWVYGRGRDVPTYYGDFCGVPFPASAGPPLIYTPMFAFFGDDERRRMLETYAAAYPGGIFPVCIDGGYVLGGREVYWPRPHYSDKPEAFTHFYQEIEGAGLRPLTFLMDDHGPRVADYLEPFVTVNRAHLQLTCIGFEVNDWMTPREITQACKRLRQMLGSGPKLFMHFTPQHGAACEGDGCEPAWWKSMSGILSGNLYQEFPTTPDANYQQNVADMVLRLTKGYWNIHPPMAVVMFERFAYYKFRGVKTERDGIQQGRIAMRVDGLAGFGDGGPMGLRLALADDEPPPTEAEEK